MNKQDAFKILIVVAVAILFVIPSKSINDVKATPVDEDRDLNSAMNLFTYYKKAEEEIIIEIKNKIIKIQEYQEKVKRKEKEGVKVLRPETPGLPLDGDLLDYIWEKSEEYDFAYSFILAIIGVESDYGRVKRNVNKNGTVDRGLAQINSSNIKFLSELAGIENVDLQNHYHNVDMMFELLKYERDYFRGLGFSEEEVFILTSMAYNMGRGNVIKYIKRNGVKENNYVKKVMFEKEKLENKIMIMEEHND